MRHVFTRCTFPLRMCTYLPSTSQRPAVSWSHIQNHSWQRLSFWLVPQIYIKRCVVCKRGCCYKTQGRQLEENCGVITWLSKQESLFSSFLTNALILLSTWERFFAVCNCHMLARTIRDRCWPSFFYLSVCSLLWRMNYISGNKFVFCLLWLGSPISQSKYRFAWPEQNADNKESVVD